VAVGNPSGSVGWSNRRVQAVCSFQCIPSFRDCSPPAAVEGQQEMVRSGVGLGGEEPTASPVRGTGGRAVHLVGSRRDVMNGSAGGVRAVRGQGGVSGKPGDAAR